MTTVSGLIPEHWRRICGVHLEPDGIAGCVWLAHDTVTSVVHCFDACKFDREVMAVIAQGISARGRQYPVAWRKQDEDFAKKLQEAGINVLPEPVTDSQAVAEVMSRDVWQRIRTGQFRVDSRVAEWMTEYRNFYRDESKIPLEGHPLMSATRHAIEMLPYARPEKMPGSKRPNYPTLAIA